MDRFDKVRDSLDAESRFVVFLDALLDSKNQMEYELVFVVKIL